MDRLSFKPEKDQWHKAISNTGPGLTRQDHIRMHDRAKRFFILVLFLVVMIAITIIASAVVEKNAFKASVESEAPVADTFPVKPREYLPQAQNRAVAVRSAGDSREVVAYNSVPGQTDATPCISADGSDICTLYEQGEDTCAANFVKLGSKLEVEGLGTCVVRDRMNARYPNHVDWYMGDDVEAARNFGRRYLKVTIL